MRLALLVIVLAAFGGHASAQDAAVTRLRAAVAAAPDDASLRCQLSFALVGAGQYAEARATATAAIAAIRTPLTAATRRTMGACLYNRGRAAEGLGDARAAATDYVESLRLRPNDAVLARLTALVPDTPPSLPAAALATFDLRDGDAPRIVAVAEGTRVVTGALTWRFFSASAPAGYDTEGVVYVALSTASGTVVERIDGWATEDASTTLRVVGASRERAADGAEVVVVSVEGTGGGACHRMEGFMDFHHRATVLLRWDAAARRLRSHVLVTSQSDCEGGVSMRVRVARGAVVVSSSRGGSLERGSFPLEELLR